MAHRDLQAAIHRRGSIPRREVGFEGVYPRRSVPRVQAAESIVN
jgi:hypothetical protein